MDSFNQIIFVLGIIAIIIMAISVHEAAHAVVAKLCGDPTAALLGRATLNPIKHIDPIGTVILPTVVFLLSGFILGWAKPVPIDNSRLKDPKIDPALVSAAGPMSNFAMALFFAFIYLVTKSLGLEASGVAVRLLEMGVQLNLMFMIFNLIPIPPLDGGHIVAHFLPYNARRQFERLEPYGIWIVMALMYFRILSPVVFSLVAALSSVMLLK